MMEVTPRINGRIIRVIFMAAVKKVFANAQIADVYCLKPLNDYDIQYNKSFVENKG
jgi:hypothetical protein